MHSSLLFKEQTRRLDSFDYLRARIIAGVCIAILALAAPGLLHAQKNELTAATISSIERSAQSPGSIDVRGKAFPRARVNIELISDDTGPLLRDQAVANESGEWSLTVGDASFKDGAYTLRAIVQDSSGILGPVTEVRGYKVQPKPLLTVNGVSLGWFDAFIGMLFLVFLLAAFGSWYYEHRRRLQVQSLLVTEHDIKSMSQNLIEEVERLDTLIRDSKGLDPQAVAEAEFLLKSQHSKLEKLQGYLSVGITKTI